MPHCHHDVPSAQAVRHAPPAREIYGLPLAARSGGRVNARFTIDAWLLLPPRLVRRRACFEPDGNRRDRLTSSAVRVCRGEVLLHQAGGREPHPGARQGPCGGEERNDETFTQAACCRAQGDRARRGGGCRRGPSYGWCYTREQGR